VSQLDVGEHSAILYVIVNMAVRDAPNRTQQMVQGTMDHGNLLDSNEPFLAGATVDRMRELVIAGEFRPGEKLSEHHVATKLDVSRNTLREAFRLLTAQGLLKYIPNRGVYVAAPDEAAVIDIYRVRSALQTRAVQVANKAHPGVLRMRTLANMASIASQKSDWKAVESLDLEFHRAMVTICDSPRLNSTFDLLLAELRLVLGQLENTACVYEPFVQLNLRIATSLESGNNEAALGLLDGCLIRSERAILGALQRTRMGLYRRE